MGALSYGVPRVYGLSGSRNAAGTRSCSSYEASSRSRQAIEARAPLATVIRATLVASCKKLCNPREVTRFSSRRPITVVYFVVHTHVVSHVSFPIQSVIGNQKCSGRAHSGPLATIFCLDIAGSTRRPYTKSMRDCKHIDEIYHLQRWTGRLVAHKAPKNKLESDDRAQ